MARVAIVGAGSVGLLVGAALLQRDDHEVLIYARSHFTRIRVPTADPPIDRQVEVQTDPRAVDLPADWVVLATKAHQSAGARGWLDALCGPTSRLVVTQGGIEQAERGRTAAPFGTAVVPAVISCAAERTGPGCVEHNPVEPVKLVVPEGVEAEDLAECFAGTIATVEATGQWATEAWRKLAFDAVTSGLCTITGRRADVLAHPGVAGCVTALLDELLAVAAASGAALDEAFRRSLLDRIGTIPGGVAPTMLQDRLASRPTEHDAIHGAVVRAADRAGLDVPLHRFLFTLLDASGER